ncbi:hypothetical protein BX667DRAFT_516652 [Coemansia mojavensis]|nr:hypothetical protein BX667DRAFT_516652 [Coemansia mojavensis]
MSSSRVESPPPPQQQQRLNSEEPLTATQDSSSASAYNRPITRPRTWFLYAADWIAAMAAVAVSQVILIPDPHAVTFVVTDPFIQQPHERDTFDITRVSVVLGTAIPVVIMLLWLGAFRFSFKDIHLSLLGLGMALSFCTLFTAIFKQATVVLSPDFLDRCDLPPEDFERSFQTGARISYRACRGPDTVPGLRFYPEFTTTIPICSLSYLSLFTSLQLGLWLHPQVRRQVRAISPWHLANRSRPGQTLVSFISLLPVAAGMSFPALEAKYHGGGDGWGTAFSIILGFIFALWAHIIYCSDMPGAMVAYIYG